MGKKLWKKNLKVFWMDTWTDRLTTDALRLIGSGEILIFVCLQKEAKQCCDAAKPDSSHRAGQFTPKMKANTDPRLHSSLV